MNGMKQEMKCLMMRLLYMRTRKVKRTWLVIGLFIALMIMAASLEAVENYLWLKAIFEWL